MKYLHRVLLLLFIVTASLGRSGAQDTVVRVPNIGKLDSLNSSILKEKRLIQVFTPENYKPGSAEKYDVLYVLDGGNWNTGMIKQIQRFLEGEAYMPPTIIVSILGIDRNKDLTPTHLKDSKTSGGAANFLSFLKNELIPYVNKNYPSNGDNTLWGHSLGGLFVTYAMLNEPAAFKSYIAVDPSFWWDNILLAKVATEKLPALKNSNITLFISGREGQDGKGMKIDTMQTVLKRFAPADLKWKVVYYPDETHSSIRLKSTYDGLRFTYKGFTDAIEFYPQGGIIEKEKPLAVRYFEDTTNVRYTLDGSAPTISSPKIKDAILLTGPATFTIKRFANRASYDRMATGVFTTDNNLRLFKSAGKLRPGGLNYAYYEGDWDKWPDLKNVKPTKTGITDKDFDTDKLPRNNNFAVVIDGMLQIKEDGYHMFFLNGDKDTRLYLGNKLLIKWSGNYKHRTNSYMVPLKKGFYPLRIEYLRKNKDFNLGWAVITPSNLKGMDASLPPPEAQYGKR